MSFVSKRGLFAVSHPNCPLTEDFLAVLSKPVSRKLPPYSKLAIYGDGSFNTITFFRMKKNPLTNSPDLLTTEIAQLAQIFPQFVSEGKVDLDGLQAYLKEEKAE